MLVWIIGRRQYERWLETTSQALLDHFSEVYEEIEAIPQEELIGYIKSKLRGLIDGQRA